MERWWREQGLGELEETQTAKPTQKIATFALATTDLTRLSIIILVHDAKIKRGIAETALTGKVKKKPPKAKDRTKESNQRKERKEKKKCPALDENREFAEAPKRTLHSLFDWKAKQLYFPDTSRGDGSKEESTQKFVSTHTTAECRHYCWSTTSYLRMEGDQTS